MKASKHARSWFLARFALAVFYPGQAIAQQNPDNSAPTNRLNLYRIAMP